MQCYRNVEVNREEMKKKLLSKNIETDVLIFFPQHEGVRLPQESKRMLRFQIRFANNALAGYLRNLRPLLF